MNNVRIGKQYTFDAAHQLVGHKGKCANLHGHTYTVVVSIAGPVKGKPRQSDDGMVMDYGDLDNIVKPIIEQLDHAMLIGPEQSVLGGNKICYIGVRSTAENIARWILTKILPSLQDTNITHLSVSVSETPKTYAEYSMEVGDDGR